VTRLVQYTATVPALYLHKFDNPYQFYSCALYIEQKTLPIDRPVKIYQAIKDALRAHKIQYEESSTPTSLKRKALADITREGENAGQIPRGKRARIGNGAEKGVAIVSG
jgi:hypothetical protein